MNKLLNGPSINFNPGEFDKIVIFLHGYGANGNDLISIGNSWQKQLPHTMFISPNAPFECSWGNNAYQWFELSSISPESIGSGLEKAGPYLNRFVDHISKETKVPHEKIFFVSFSQGTMMALYHLCKRNSECAGIMGYSGLLLCDENFDVSINSKPPIRLYHGKNDDVITFEQTISASSKLKSLNFDVEHRIKEFLGHGIDEDGLKYGLEFIKKTFNI
tara:strand:- start:191 stop:844 length:654 start_codon:yes stop_codon:yes gene_type:complete